MAQLVKNPPAMQEIQVQSLGQEDPLEKETATRSSILAWNIPWTEELGRLQFMASQRIRHDFSTKPNLSLRDTEEPALKDGFLILQRKFKGGWGEICPCKSQ